MNYLCHDFGHVHTLMTTFYEVFTFQKNRLALQHVNFI